MPHVERPAVLRAEAQASGRLRWVSTCDRFAYEGPIPDRAPEAHGQLAAHVPGHGWTYYTPVTTTLEMMFALGRRGLNLEPHADAPPANSPPSAPSA